MMVLSWVLLFGIGVVLGVLGGGGAILSMPILIYLLHLEPRVAIAVSLFLVGTTSALGALLHARAGTVQGRVGLFFGGAAMAAAYVGGKTARFVPANGLLILFAIVMVVTGLAMVRPRAEGVEPPRPLALGRALSLGALVGFFSGLVGAGGGFLIVPALTLFGGVTLRQAIGTSLFVITLQSLAGFLAQVGFVTIDWSQTLGLAGAALAGALTGVAVAKKISAHRLRTAFAWLVLGMGLFMVGKQIRWDVALGLSPFVLGLGLFMARSSPRTRLPPEKGAPRPETLPPSPGAPGAATSCPARAAFPPAPIDGAHLEK